MSFLVELPQSEYNRNAFAHFAPTGGFDNGTGTALAMAWMSQLAYETRLPDKIRAIGALFGLAEIRILQQPAKSTLPLSDTRGIIANKDNALIIAFAGTDPLNLLNWVSDFYLGRPNTDVHEGQTRSPTLRYLDWSPVIYRTPTIQTAPTSSRQTANDFDKRRTDFLPQCYEAVHHEFERFI